MEVIKKELPILLVVTSMFTLSILAHELSFTNDFILNSQDGILFICL